MIVCTPRLNSKNSFAFLPTNQFSALVSAKGNFYSSFLITISLQKWTWVAYISLNYIRSNSIYWKNWFLPNQYEYFLLIEHFHVMSPISCHLDWRANKAFTCLNKRISFVYFVVFCVTLKLLVGSFLCVGVFNSLRLVANRYWRFNAKCFFYIEDTAHRTVGVTREVNRSLLIHDLKD